MGQHRRERSRTADGSVGQSYEIQGGLAAGSRRDTPEKALSQTLKTLRSKALTVPWTSRPPDGTLWEGGWAFLCPGSATSLLCDLSKVVSPPWVSRSLPICALKALGPDDFLDGAIELLG